MKYFILFCVISSTSVFAFKATDVFRKVYGEIKPEPIGEDVGNPLILTEYLKTHSKEEARAAAAVNLPVFQDVESYSGYFTVDEAFDSNLFFWFFPSAKDYKNDPVVLWLQGGPGSTSLYGLFDEHGPFIFNDNGTLELREYSWHKTHSVIYIDNPVGTGFSFTSGGYAQNETKVGEDLYNALVQFFDLWSELQTNDFFITGESYAGKYVPAISYTVHKKNPEAELRINLKGLAIGNGFCHPELQMKYSDYLYQLGLIDGNSKTDIKELEDQAVEAMQQDNYLSALDKFNSIVDKFLTLSGFENYYNYLIAVDNSPQDRYMAAFVQSDEVRRAIHVGQALFGNGGEVSENLSEDFMRSIIPWLTELLNHYRVMIYNGQLDIILAYPYTVNYLKELDFDGAEDYKTAKRKIFYVEDEIAGYYKQAGNLTEVLVRNAGHLVPQDQPKWAFALINTFTANDFD